MDINVSNITKATVIPPKVRAGRTTTNPLAERMEQLASKAPGHSFTIYDTKLKDVHSRVYAAAKKLGLRIVTRTQGDDVLVISVNEDGEIPTSGSKRASAASA